MTATETARRGNFYTRAWSALPRDLGYLALTGVLLITAYALLYGLFFGGVGSLAAVVGIFLILGALYGARLLGEFELVRLGWAGFSGIRPVIWGPGTGSNGFWRFFSALGQPHYWLYLLHALLLLPIVGFVSLTVSVTWFFTGLFSVLAPLLSPLLPENVSVGAPWNRAAEFFSIAPAAVWTISVITGLLMLAVFPLITRVFTMLHFQIGRLALSGFRSETLSQQVTDLSASRGAAISAEGHSLRRLERDIHDGPQQRLVRLQMDLSAADRQLDNDPAAARLLITEAMAQSKEALEELRALSRGFAPPFLLDRGLVAALESAAVRGTVPTRIVNELPIGLQLPLEVERNAYFVASESMANADKHSAATGVEVRVSLRDEPPVSLRDGESDTRWLDVTITDDGRGGAASIAGHGIEGLEQRLLGFGGTFSVLSPVGGPTSVAASFPLPAELSPVENQPVENQPTEN